MSEKIKYPCTSCDRNETCNTHPCASWLNWFRVSWRDTTDMFKNLNKKEKESNKMRIKLDKGAYMPTRAHKTDAGLDIYARETQIVLAKDSAIFDTGVHIELPPNTVGMLKSKSGLNVKHGITSEGVIDVGYTGSIVVKLYNNSGYDYTVNAGDKISQLVILPILAPELECVDELESTERGEGGFGSTGR